jgi:hypothetical protein
MLTPAIRAIQLSPITLFALLRFSQGPDLLWILTNIRSGLRERRGILAISLLKINLARGLTLALFVARICIADHPHDTFTAHNFAVAADLLY